MRCSFFRDSLNRAMSRRDIVNLGSSMITHANLPWPLFFKEGVML
jgi:hypothetical protein